MAEFFVIAKSYKPFPPPIAGATPKNEKWKVTKKIKEY